MTCSTKTQTPLNAAKHSVLILGADGFIGRHIAFGLRAKDYRVLCSARRTGALKEMGFSTLKADLTDPNCHHPDFWAPHVADLSHVVNAAGLLTGSERQFEAVHVLAPKALYEALPKDIHAVHISAVGINAQTRFANFRRKGEEVARQSGRSVSIIRPGLVLADTSYGGSSAIRALAIFPWFTPVIGDGKQAFNPIHAADLTDVIAEILESDPIPEPIDVCGPETLSQAALLACYRAWFGLQPARLLRLPTALARAFGTLGDALKLGPISRTAVAQLEHGVAGSGEQMQKHTGVKVRGFSEFLANRPAGSQDIWQARLYLLRPAIRLGLALMWAISGLLGLFAPPESFLPFLSQSNLPETLLIMLARAGGLADLAIALALLRAWQLRRVAVVQLLLVVGYTVGLSLLAPALWFDPLGALIKNIPIILLIICHMVLEVER